MHETQEFDRNPHLPLERMTGADLPQILGRLTSMGIDGFRFDEHQFRTVVDRLESQDGRRIAVCEAEDGTRLLLNYDPADNQEPVNFTVLPVDKAS